MNKKTYEHLDYQKLKEKIANYCTSNLGKNAILNLTPSTKFDVVSEKLKESQEAISLLRSTGQIPLGGLYDISHHIVQLEKGYILQPDALQVISDFLRSCKKISLFMEKQEFIAPTIASYARSMSRMEFLQEEIERCIQNSMVVDTASSSLSKIRRLLEHEESRIRGALNEILNKPFYKGIFQERFVSERAGCFTLCVKSEYQKKIAGTIVERSQSKSAVFIEPSSVNKYTQLRNQYLIEESEEIYKIISRLSNELYENIRGIQINIDCMKVYDMLFAKAKYALEENAVIVSLNKSEEINLYGGSHPLIENFIPLSMHLGKEFRSLIITGPNAGGKTVALKTLGLLSLAVQSGFPIPASDESSFCVFEKILTDMGDSQSIENSLSTFSGHVSNLVSFEPFLSRGTLVLLDEIGSGTDPRIGAALAISLLEHFYEKGALIFASTHYGEIKEFAEQHRDFENARMRFDKQTLSPLYRLEIGHSGDSEAFWICQRMQMKSSILERAQQYLKGSSIIQLKSFSFPKESKENSSETKIVQFSQGDLVSFDGGKKGLVYRVPDSYGMLSLYYEKNFISIHHKKVTVVGYAKDLYPQEYPIESLFSEYSDRKLQHDIQRGSKKALKKIEKYNRKKRI